MARNETKFTLTVSESAALMAFLRRLAGEISDGDLLAALRVAGYTPEGTTDLIAGSLVRALQLN